MKKLAVSPKVVRTTLNAVDHRKEMMAMDESRNAIIELQNAVNELSDELTALKAQYMSLVPATAPAAPADVPGQLPLIPEAVATKAPVTKPAKTGK